MHKRKHEGERNAHQARENDGEGGDAACAVEDAEHRRKLHLIESVVDPRDYQADDDAAECAGVECGYAQDGVLTGLQVGGVDDAQQDKQLTHDRVHGHVADEA